MNDLTKTCAALTTAIRQKNPLIHNITNYVTVNDCANAILAIGASPIMADDLAEAADITSISSALVVNMGTLNARTIASMLAASKKANALGIPVIFDPVGAGASDLRNETTKQFIAEVKIAVLRGNLSEVSFVAGLNASTKGVDVSDADSQNNADAIGMAVSKKLSCVVGITGPMDTVCDGHRIAKISNGHPLLSKVTGTGCMTSALVGSFCGVESDYFTAATTAIAVMGISGELAFDKSGKNGTGSFRISIIDALSNMNSELFAERAKIDEQ